MGTHTHAPRGAGTTPSTPRPNKYGGKCARPGCGQWVPAGEGLLGGSKGAWTTTHAGECPAPKAPAKNAEPGYYVRPKDGKAIVVVQSKRDKSRTYGKVLTFPEDGSRPSWEYVAGAGYTVADLRPMTAADAAEMGLSHGFCIRCCAPLGGETLSAAISALVGYGETCASKMGWPYPKGVVTQRAFLAEHGG